VTETVKNSEYGGTVMKKPKVVISSLAIFVVIWALASGARADDQQVISNLERKIATATTADEAKKYWGSGDDVELFDMMGPPREFVGQKAILEHAQEFAGYKDVKVDFLELKVISDGKLALARSVQRYTAKGSDGKSFDVTFRQTDLWRKTNGQWKIVNSHVSVPIDMKTGKADMASKM
jgi:ketosteroid isomerase-like protein